MKRVATAVVLIPLVLLAVFRAPAWLFIFLLGAIALLAANEYLNIVAAYGLKPFRWLTLALIAVQFAIAIRQSFAVSPYFDVVLIVGEFVVLITGALVMLTAAMTYGDLRTALPSVSLSLLAFLYVAFPLLSMATLLGPSDLSVLQGRFRIFALLLFVWAGDGFAYYIGKGLGRHPMAPRISPKKTWEGAAGSVLGSLVAATVVWAIATRTDWRVLFQSSSLLYWTIMAILVNVAAQIGDLVESMMKRGAGLKDSGNLLPGHGGILDRIDALLFAAPVMCYYPGIAAAVLEMFRSHP